MGAKIHIGTSGYSYNDWIGPFYPPDIHKPDFLQFYSSRFSMVELNFTYYRQPEPQILSRMLAATDSGFLFSLKAHRSLTHEREGEESVTTYLKGVEPLAESGRLAAVLMQFPFSFHYTVENRRYLGKLCDRMKALPVATEFRNVEWQRQSVYDELTDRGVAYTVVDCPRLDNLPEPVPVTTANLGYIRFHGRNEKNWWNGTNESRYDFLYSEGDLEKWLNRIADMAGNTSILLIAFNNHWRGQAPRNAVQLEELLRKRPGLDVVHARHV